MILLDTHVLVWWVQGDSPLPPAVRHRLDQEPEIAVSPISFWELGNLLRLKRIAIEGDPSRWLRRLLGQGGVSVAQLTPHAALGAGMMADFHADPADRLIYTTARELRVPLATKDRRIRDYALRVGDVEIIW